VDFGGGNTKCTTKCETNNDCPAGYNCFDIREGDTLVGKSCAPTDLVCGSASGGEPEVWINEIHYDNASFDSGEGVELAGKAGTDLTGYSLVFYNGKAGQLRAYKSVTIEEQLPGSAGIGVLWLPIANVQNGGADGSPEPDGIALVDAHGTVLSFISYEGAFTPTNGPAAGMQSLDIGVSELSTSPEGQSLGLAGTGKSYSAFSWTAGPASPGGKNPGQTFQ
jgi:hypothetical protein